MTPPGHSPAPSDERSRYPSPHAPVHSPDVVSDEGISLFRLVNVVLRHRVLIAALTLGLGALGAAASLLSRRTYTAMASFMPQARQTASAASGLAAQLGLNIEAGQASEQPQFYVDLITSREILGDAVDTRYRVQTDSGLVLANLVALGPKSERPPRQRRAIAIEALREQIQLEVAQRTGVITLKVTMPHPRLARDVAARLIELVSAFNLTTRQSRASAERRFLEQQVEVTRNDLRGAEARLQSFLQRNRDYQTAPALSFEHDRLQREAGLRADMYRSMMQGLQQARIEEVRNTPVITVLDAPEEPVLPDGRGTIRRTLIGLALGVLLGLALAIAREYVAAIRLDDPDGFREFRQLRRATVRDLVQPWRPLMRMLRRGAPE